MRRSGSQKPRLLTTQAAGGTLIGEAELTVMAGNTWSPWV